MNLEEEFDRQIGVFCEKGYPKLAGLSTTKFISMFHPLNNSLVDIAHGDMDIDNGKLPFVLVVQDRLVPPSGAMSHVERNGKEGVIKLAPLETSDFHTREDVRIPSSDVYALVGVDRGKESLNVTPEMALLRIQKDGRSPLTIQEGIAIVTLFPEFLTKNNCFSLLASRHTGDQRVPAIWIEASKRPKLGWCWDRNPHTWLGSASCAKRIE